MSDVLSPAEQARAARWAAQALYERAPTSFQASRYALREIADHLDPPEPPETVESLRAERDSARQDADGWETSAHEIQDHCDAALADVTHWREQYRLVCDESEDRNTEIARLRSTHTEAEAAWERSKRQPRLWHKGDAEPVGVNQVVDGEAGVWSRDADGEWTSPSAWVGVYRWDNVIGSWGPLTEVLK